MLFTSASAFLQQADGAHKGTPQADGAHKGTPQADGARKGTPQATARGAHMYGAWPTLPQRTEPGRCRGQGGSKPDPLGSKPSASHCKTLGSCKALPRSACVWHDHHHAEAQTNSDDDGGDTNNTPDGLSIGVRCAICLHTSVFELRGCVLDFRGRRNCRRHVAYVN